MIIGITGHRPQSVDNDFSLTSPIWQWVRAALREFFIESQPNIIVSGMALGSDTVAAEVAMDLNIKVRAAVPFKGQESTWPEESKQRYYKLLEKCHDVFEVSEPGYATWKLHARNQFIVDNSNFMVAIWNGDQKGGTWSAVNYAIKRKHAIKQINPKTKTVRWYQSI